MLMADVIVTFMKLKSPSSRGETEFITEERWKMASSAGRKSEDRPMQDLVDVDVRFI